AMEACGQAGVEFIVVDRPNPLGGDRGEGPRVAAGFQAFVSQWNIPYVYVLMCGDLARMINAQGVNTNPCILTVCPARGGQRSMVGRDDGLPWVPSSPEVPRGDSPLFQVATGMVGEIGGVSTGIGYTLPSQCIAAPGLDPQKTADLLNAYQLPGIRFKP